MGIVKRNKYVKGSHNSVSDLSGQKYKRKDMCLTWQNYLVGKDEYFEKQPQLNIRSRPDRPSIKDQTRTQDPPTQLLDPPFNPAGGV